MPTCMCIDRYRCILKHTDAYAHVCMRMCTFVYIYVHMCIHVTCVSMCMHMCSYMYKCVQIYLQNPRNVPILSVTSIGERYGDS